MQHKVESQVATISAPVSLKTLNNYSVKLEDIQKGKNYITKLVNRQTENKNLKDNKYGKYLQKHIDKEVRDKYTKKTYSDKTISEIKICLNKINIELKSVEQKILIRKSNFPEIKKKIELNEKIKDCEKSKDLYEKINKVSNNRIYKIGYNLIYGAHVIGYVFCSIIELIPFIRLGVSYPDSRSFNVILKEESTKQEKLTKEVIKLKKTLKFNSTNKNLEKEVNEIKSNDKSLIKQMNELNVEYQKLEKLADTD